MLLFFSAKTTKKSIQEKKYPIQAQIDMDRQGSNNSADNSHVSEERDGPANIKSRIQPQGSDALFVRPSMEKMESQKKMEEERKARNIQSQMTAQSIARDAAVGVDHRKGLNVPSTGRPRKKSSDSASAPPGRVKKIISRLKPSSSKQKSTNESKSNIAASANMTSREKVDTIAGIDEEEANDDVRLVGLGLNDMVIV